MIALFSSAVTNIEFVDIARETWYICTGVETDFGEDVACMLGLAAFVGVETGYGSYPAEAGMG
jgi:hypothetical protein